MDSMNMFSHVAMTSCPRCQLEVSKERIEQAPAVCQNCGFTSSAEEHRHEDLYTKKFIKGAVVATVIAVSAFVHAVNWGDQFLTIIPLKLRSMVGAASTRDLREIAQICNARLRYECMESALTSIVNKETSDTETLVQLGNIRRLMGDTAGAEQAYRTHIARGGQSNEAHFHLARILDKTNRVAEAKEMYQKTLLLRSEVLQVTVIQSFVDMLVRNNELQAAKDVIQDVRNSSDTAKFFMVKEFDEISRKMGAKI